MPDATPAPDPDALFGNSVSDLFRHALEATAPSPVTQPWQPPTPEHLAGMLPQYQIESLIGRGGMGAVYKGRQASLKRAVAIKLLPAELSANAEFTSRFEREAQTLASLSHQGIVAIFDFGQTEEGHLYFIMEFVDGTDLAHLLHTQRLASDQALELTLQICEALHYAHSQGVVHRDIKPANVLITRDGRAKLADFGLARPLSAMHTQLTATNAVMGTPDYMAPEQWQGKADHRADIYALGVMLYEMLTGTRPQGAFDLPSIKSRVDARLDEVVVKAMRQEPDRRYQQVSELREAVDRIRTTRPPQPAAAPRHPFPAPASAEQAPPLKTRSAFDTLMWAVLVFLLVGLGWGAVAFLASNQDLKPAPAPGAEIAAVITPPVERPVTPPASQPAPPATPSVVKPTPAVPKPEPLPVAKPTVVPPPTTPPPPPPVPVVEPSPACIDILKTQVPNSMKWVLAPLDEAVPGDIRQNLTLLREDLVDEGKTKPAAPLPVYSAAWQLCQALLTALNERDRSRVAAGYRDAQAAANQTNTNQALDARRNYRMSWPQYAREESQRAELRSAATNQSQVMKEQPKVEWSNRTTVLRRSLDDLYAKFRKALRQSPAPEISASPSLPASASSPLGTATTKAPFINTLGMKFVPVRINGGTTNRQRVLFGIWQTRVQDYEEFVKETKHPWIKVSFQQGPTHPAVFVSWDDAQAFCRWLTQRERQTGHIKADQAYRLPSDHEWSCAVDIGDREDAAKTPAEKSNKISDAFPWGTSWPPKDFTGNYASEELSPLLMGATKPTNVRDIIANYRDGYGVTSPVGNYAPNRHGLYDMGGNVWQWCEDWYDSTQTGRVRRGTCWNNGSRFILLSSHREQNDPSACFNGFGFRCVLAPVSSLSPRLPDSKSSSATKEAP